MNTKFQLRVQRYGWDAAAEVYHQQWAENLSPAHQAMFEMAPLNPADRVIEIASGSGFLTFQVASKVGADGHILATDISAEMIKLLQAQARDSSLANIKAERVGAEDLGQLADGSYDAALCALGLMFMPEPGLGILAMHQALKPGGLAVAAVWGQRNRCHWADIFPIVDNEVKSEVCPLFFSLGAGDALQQSFQKQGFTNLETRRIETTLQFDNTESLLAAIIDGGAVALAAKRFEPETRQRVDDNFLNSVKEYRQGEGYAIPAEFVVVAGQKSA